MSIDGKELRAIEIQCLNAYLQKPQTSIVDGLEWINIYNPKDSYYPESHERQCINIALSNTISCFWDIGAYNGMYALRLAKSGKNVYAFEPNPKSYEILTSNIKLNKLTIHSNNIALSSWDY